MRFNDSEGVWSQIYWNEIDKEWGREREMKFKSKTERERESAPDTIFPDKWKTRTNLAFFSSFDTPVTCKDL